MRQTIRRHFLGFALLALPSIVEAKGITYDCDTAANHFSELVLPAGTGPFTVSGSVKLNALAETTKYAPLTRVEIASSAPAGQSPEVFAGFTLTALPADGKKTPSGESAVQMLSYTSNGKKDDVLPLSLLTKPGTVQRFTLSFDGGRVLVDLGNDNKSFPLKTNNPVVRLVCSTGEFLFTDLTIATTGGH
ncbi:hypothetical protein [Sphingomonas sp. PAMC 26617]|uniref:hypothetical protein n=1 Tax=Sphingomonas sp. PAMC 26617 TaxID=1112216 RepID=UPI0012F4C51C|nr:hypothetical protein [Sphingomonas sp. PAMC 26617]